MNTVEISGTDEPEDTFTDFVYGFASTAGVLFASCASGLYRSTDDGQTWHNISESLRPALRVDGMIPTTAVALSSDFGHDHTLFTAVGGLILRSADTGEHWIASQVAGASTIISALVVSPSYEQDGIVAVGTVEDGFFRSADRGAHWAAWNFGLLDLHVLCLAISPDFGYDETLFIGTQSGLFRSTNGGRAWREIELPTGYSAVLSVAISPAYAQDGVVFAATETGAVMKSASQGEQWAIVTEVDTPISSIVLHVDYPRTPYLLLIAGSRLLLSPNDGTAWAVHSMEQDGEVSAILAPWGLDEGLPLVSGFVGGRIRQLRLPDLHSPSQ